MCVHVGVSGARVGGRVQGGVRRPPGAAQMDAHLVGSPGLMAPCPPGQLLGLMPFWPQYALPHSSCPLKEPPRLKGEPSSVAVACTVCVRVWACACVCVRGCERGARGAGACVVRARAGACACVTTACSA
jgi:hypothetical protein